MNILSHRTMLISAERMISAPVVTTHFNLLIASGAEGTIVLGMSTANVCVILLSLRYHG